MPPYGPAIELEVDAGYIRGVPKREGVRWIAVIASKLVRPVVGHGYAHAYAGTCNPHQGVRQQDFLASLGVPPAAPVTVLSDGGEDITFACRLPRPTEQVLDWFHIAMRFEHLLTAVRGLRHADEFTKQELARRIEGAKWLLWHGWQERCLQRLEALRRDTGWAGFRNLLGKLIRYLRSGREPAFEGLQPRDVAKGTALQDGRSPAGSATGLSPPRPAARRAPLKRRAQ